MEGAVGMGPLIGECVGSRRQAESCVEMDLMKSTNKGPHRPCKERWRMEGLVENAPPCVSSVYF